MRDIRYINAQSFSASTQLTNQIKMSIAVEPNTIVSLGKRKRNDVSYFQTDIDIDEDTDNSIQGEDDFTTDDDGTYGSRRVSEIASLVDVCSLRI